MSKQIPVWNPASEPNVQIIGASTAADVDGYANTIRSLGGRVVTVTAPRPALDPFAPWTPRQREVIETLSSVVKMMSERYRQHHSDGEARDRVPPVLLHIDEYDALLEATSSAQERTSIHDALDLILNLGHCAGICTIWTGNSEQLDPVNRWNLTRVPATRVQTRRAA